jgi:sulfite oxidase
VPGKVPPFIRSIPIEKALDPDTLLATTMNGSPLTKHHGYPVRALVPGWIGAASCKWLTEIRVLEHEFEGNFMNPGYRMPKVPLAPGGSVKPEDTAVITVLNVKSVITTPIAGSEQRLAPVHITGAAWAGEADVTKVDVSTDGGSSWRPAQLDRLQAKYAWRLWEYTWKPHAAGSYVLMSRATDSRGRTQAMQAPWNPAGYLWNGIDQVKINVTA